MERQITSLDRDCLVVGTAEPNEVPERNTEVQKEFKQLLQTQKSLCRQHQGLEFDSGSPGQPVEANEERSDLLGWCNTRCSTYSGPSVSPCMLGDNHGQYQELESDTTWFYWCCKEMWPRGLLCDPPPFERLWRTISSDCCFIRCHSSSSLILSGRQILTIILRQVLTKTWILFMVVTVVLWVSAA